MSDTAVDPRDLELLDQILKLEGAGRGPGDPNDVQVHRTPSLRVRIRRLPRPTPCRRFPEPAAAEPNDLLHIGEHLVGYKPEPKALTREQSLQRLREHPELIKGPIWATYPDGGRERVPCHP